MKMAVSGRDLLHSACIFSLQGLSMSGAGRQPRGGKTGETAR